MKQGLLFVIFAILSSAGSALAAGDGNALQKVFDEAIEAVGGAGQISQIRSVEAFANCTGPKGKYTTAVTSFRNDQTHFRQTFSYRPVATDIFIAGELALKKTPGSEEYAVVPPFQKLVVRLHEYQRMAFDFQNMFSDFKLIGAEQFSDTQSIRVDAKNELGGPIRLYFDKKTKLLNGYILPIPNSDQQVRNVFNKWKKVGDVRLPAQVTATDPAGIWVLKFDRITLNEGVENPFNLAPEVLDLADLMRLHRQHQIAHLTYNAERFVETFADDLVTIQNGTAITRDRAENLERIKKYFSSFKFKKWGDIRPPVVKISQDGTLATIIVEKRVEGTYQNEKGETVESVTDFAWLEVWEKIDGQWKITTVASTRK